MNLVGPRWTGDNVTSKRLEPGGHGAETGTKVGCPDAGVRISREDTLADKVVEACGDGLLNDGAGHLERIGPYVLQSSNRYGKVVRTCWREVWDGYLNLRVAPPLGRQDRPVI